MAKRTKYNHKQSIQSFQPAPSKSIYPGMIVDFRYGGETVNDTWPFVLVIFNDHKEDKLHGINLNYLPKKRIGELFKKLSDGAKVYGKRKSNIFLIEDQVDEDSFDDASTDDEEDDKLPYRNLLKKPYTRLRLPTYKETRTGKGNNTTSLSEAKIQMKMLYERVIKRFMRRGEAYQVYRSYDFMKIKTIRVLTLDMKRLQ